LEPVRVLEKAAEALERDLPPLQGFLLPGGHPSAAWAHVARTVCRRAERLAAAVPSPDVLPFLNRLSTYLYALARSCNRQNGVPETQWKPFSFDLTDLAGQTVTLRFETDPGPRDDAAFDFALWGGRELELQGFVAPKPPERRAPPALELRRLYSAQNDEVAPQGGGEPAIVPVGAAIANAMSNAFGGYRFTKVPIRREDIVTALQYLKDNGLLTVAELVDHLGKLVSEPEDDVAMMGVELLLQKAQRKTINIPSLPRELAHAENAILPVLENMGYGERAIFAVKLALEEAAINAIKHGNELDDTKKVTIGFAIDENNAVISVLDEGEGFDPKDVPDPTSDEFLMATSGRGLALIHAYMDEVRYNDKGNEITMIKYAPWAAAKRS
jgi:serine/threonine-protein kinase RsbW